MLALWGPLYELFADTQESADPSLELLILIYYKVHDGPCQGACDYADLKVML